MHLQGETMLPAPLETVWKASVDTMAGLFEDFFGKHTRQNLEQDTSMVIYQYHKSFAWIGNGNGGDS